MQRPLLFLLLALLVACQPRPVPQAPTTGPQPWPAFDFQQAAAAGEPVYQLDAAASRVDIVVRRSGTLARFGHDHVIVADQPEGWLWWPEAGAGRAEIRIWVEQLQVDPVAGRLRHALDTKPSATAVEATRSNMLNVVLESSRWPQIILTLSELSLIEGRSSALVTFTVKGVDHTERVSFDLDRSVNSLTVDGQLSLSQAELGLAAFSALGGGLQVADTVDIHFRLVAKPTR